MCAVFGLSHPMRACDGFKKMPITERWNVAKQGKFCYRCLRNNHFGSDCTRRRKCGIDGCCESHNRLLHRTEMKNLQGTIKVDMQSNNSGEQKAQQTTRELSKQAEHEQATHVTKQ